MEPLYNNEGHHLYLDAHKWLPLAKNLEKLEEGYKRIQNNKGYDQLSDTYKIMLKMLYENRKKELRNDR